MTAQGHPRRIFATAIERGNIVMAEATARELGRISLENALALTALVAEKDPKRRSRFAVRWLRRLLEEDESLTIEEAAVFWERLHRTRAVPFLPPIESRRNRYSVASPEPSQVHLGEVLGWQWPLRVLLSNWSTPPLRSSRFV